MILANQNKKISALLKRSFDNGVSVFIEDEKLKISADKDVNIDPELVALLRENKEQILAFLKENTQTETEEIKSFMRDGSGLFLLSFAQERLWFIDKLEGSVHYHIPGLLRLKGDLQVQHLEDAFRTIVNRHEVLRTVLVERQGTGYQQIMDKDLWQLEHASAPGNLDNFITEYVNRPFDLSSDHSLRACLVRGNGNEHLLIIVLHHIAADGWSMPLLVSELQELYSAAVQQRTAHLPELPVQYADYALWQRHYLQGDVLEQKLEYWQKQLQGVTPLQLPTDHPRPAIQRTRGHSLHFHLEKELRGKLVELSQQEGCTLFMTLLSVFKVLLHRYSGQQDICVGSPIAGRTQKALEPLIGFFVNTLVLRSQVEPELSFRQLLSSVRSSTLEAYGHQDVPFEKIVERVEQGRDRSRTPIFQVMFVLQNNVQAEEVSLPGVELKAEAVAAGVSKFDLTVHATEREQGIDLVLEYNTDLFFEESMQRMAAHFSELLRAVVNNPGQQVGRLKMLSAAEERQVLIEFNDTDADYPKDKTIIHLFEDQVRSTPGQTAVVFEDRSLTYKELNELSNQLAHYLRKNYSVQPDDLIAVLLPRSEWMIVALLAVLKSGGAYVPIDPDYPEDRIHFMIEDSGCRLVINEEELKRFKEQQHEFSVSDPEHINAPSHLAYVIYTSGTTGRPKGTLIEHRNVVRLMKNDRALFDFTADDVWTLFHSFCFDFSVWEMYGALLFGGKLIVVPPIITKDPALFVDLLAHHKVTVLNQTPSSFYNVLSAELKRPVADLGVRYVIFGGEALSPSRLREWKERYPSTRLVNMYGITETTVHVTFKEIGWKEIEAGISNIGGPIPTLRCYVLDEQGGLCAIGVPGELYVGGAGVARGYLNREELTAQKFLSSPFHEGERLYRSGDKARWLPGGELEYLGRIDEQVKIRGYRIELGEIENALQQCPLVRASVVIMKEDSDGHKRLVAYIVAEGPYDREAIQSWLSTRLPSYMIPSLMMELKELPLTSNGKIDRKALPDVHAGAAEEGYVAPRNALEQKLADIWSEVLGLEQVGVKDSFFHIGGDSIKAIRVISKTNQLLQGSVTIADLYAHQTIAELAVHLSGTKTDEMQVQLSKQQQAVEALRDRVLLQMEDASGVEDIYPMSDIQKGMFFYSLKEQEQAIYHDQMVHQITEHDFDPGRFRTAYGLMIAKHSILRTGFSFSAYEEPVQIVYRDAVADYQHYELQDLSREEQQSYLVNFLQQDREQPFDIARPSLSRLRTFHLGEDHYCYMFICHHSIIDGWSDASFNVELFATYHRLKQDATFIPAPLKSSYRDFVLEQLVEKSNAATIDWWKKELGGFKRLELPPVRRQETPGGYYYQRELGADLLEELKIAARQMNSSVQQLCFSAYVYGLGMLSYQKDFVVGLVTNNRPAREDGDKLLGCFLNTIPVRVQVPASVTWRGYIEYIYDKLLAVRRYGKLPLLDIVQHIGEKTSEQNPLFDTLFNYVDFHVYRNEAINGQEKLPEDERLAVQGRVTTNTLLNIHLNATLDRFLLQMDYSASILSQELAEKLAHYFEAVLRHIIRNPEQPARNEDILLPEEKRQLMVDFNDTDADYPKDKTITNLFEEQVRSTPGQAAVVFEDRSLTYKELNELSNQLAHYLRKNYSVQPDDLIAVLLPRSEWMVVALLAVLKSGGAYVPIDPDYPEDRIHFMIEDSGCRLVINEEELKRFKEQQHEFSVSDPEQITAPSHLAYVIYTSGTTGRPKGTLIEHRNVVRLMKNDRALFDFTEDDVWTLFHSFCFDFSVWEMYGALLFGGKLIVVPSLVTKDPSLFVDLLAHHKVTVLNQTPSSFYNVLSAELKRPVADLGIRYVIFGGEALSPSRLREWKERYPSTRLVNMYGITETTVHVTFKEIEWKEIEAGISNIGGPIPTLRCYVLDEQGGLCAIGVPGELYVGGAGVARGYLNREELTAQKFIGSPFHEGERLYRSGDKARWLSGGELEYLGRIDEQVKIRGYRIELGEIENALQQCPLVRASVVVVKEDADGHKRLVAYIVAENIYDREAIQSWLSTRLPSYMIPSLMMELKELPLTSNGKIDRKALPDPDAAFLSSKEYTAPTNEFEKDMALIWQDLLGMEQVGIHDNFFELGGDSIITIQVVSRAQRIGYTVRPKDLFIHQTIAALSAAVCSTLAVAVQSEQGLLTGPCGLLPIQQWFFDKELDARSHFNQSVLLKIPRDITPGRLEAAVKQLVQHHDALRFRYHYTASGWQQEYAPSEANLWISNLEDHAPGHLNEAITGIANRHQSGLDIEKGELIRVVLMQLPAAMSHNRLLIIIHHLAVDGVSWRILLEDLAALISAGEQADHTIILHAKTSSCRQWYTALENYASGKRLLSQKEYWKERATVNHALPVDEDYDGPIRVEDVRKLSVRLDAKATRDLLQKAPKAYHTEINDLLLAALGKTLCNWCGEDRIVIGMEGHGREDIDPGVDTSRTVGWFTSLYPVLLERNPGRDAPADWIRSVKEQLRQVPDKGIGYGILKYMLREQSLQVADPWEIMFNYLGQADTVVAEGRLLRNAEESAGDDVAGSAAGEKITVNSIVAGGELVLHWNFSSRHYKHQTIERLANDYIAHLMQLVIHCLEQGEKASIYTPSDYGLGGEVSYEELDRFLDKGKTMDSIMEF